MTFADRLPTLDGIKRLHRSKPGIVTVGNVMVRIYKGWCPTASGKYGTVFEVSEYTNGRRRLRGFGDTGEPRTQTVKAAGMVWKYNALGHSFISYRLADTQNAAQVALEGGKSPQIVFKHYRELVKPEAAKAWFAIAPQEPANVVPLTATQNEEASL
jgi:hypothetical protein